MKTLLATLFFFVAACTTKAQKAIDGNSITGVWKGTSICQVKNSPCHDESVIYYIAKVQGVDTFNIAANKIVAGKEEEMGVITCKWDKENNKLRSTSHNGQWTFNFKDDRLDGTLYYQGNLYRIIKLKKER